jgi:geranylgeranylglycerol-phosphate geranylgeranyltransferase
MNSLLPYLKILRLQNTLLAGVAVALGFWLGHSVLSGYALVLLVVAAVSATGFGNVVNDLKDVETDTISHPGRPLPRGEMTMRAAGFYACYLAFISLLSSGFVSPKHLAATATPLLLLFLYTRFLKGTPLIGNMVVSLLVAYALLFGGLSAPLFNRLLIPALLAFLLNMAREIIKDLEDKPGDSAAGIVTTAVLSLSSIKTVVYSISSLYLLLLFAPFVLHHFGNLYAVICAAVIVPLQICWLVLYTKKEPRLSLISLLIKLEMAVGLLALAVDNLLKQ